MRAVGLESGWTGMEAFLLVLQEQLSIQAFNQFWKGQGAMVAGLASAGEHPTSLGSFHRSAATFSLHLDSLLRAEEQKGHGDTHFGY